MKHNLYTKGSVDDVKGSLKISPLQTLEDCAFEREQEAKNKNRRSVLHLIDAQQRKILKAQKHA